MLIYLAILFLFVTPVVILILRLARPGFGYHWLLAIAGAGSAWVLVLLAGLELPQTLEPMEWQPAALFPASPLLIADQFSWPFAAGVATLLLAVILTDAARPVEVDWSIWADELALAGWGLLAVLAGNPLTLLLAWTAVDLLELAILLGEVKGGAARPVVIRFSARVAGTFLLIAAVMSSVGTGLDVTYSLASPLALLLFVIAVGLRLGFFQLSFPNPGNPVIRRGLDVLALLFPAASALLLVVRAASTLETSVLASPYLFLASFLAGGVALLAAVAWFLSPDESAGSQFWVLATASLALAAALRGLPQASLAWGLAAIFAGGLLFLASSRNQRISWLLMAGLAAISALPLTPAWNGAALFTAPYSPGLLLFLFSHILLLVGYANHGLRLAGSFTGLERWVFLIYPLGLGLLVLVYYLIGWRIRPPLAGLPPVMWLEGPLALGVAGLTLVWFRRKVRLSPGVQAIVASVFSLGWLDLPARLVYQLLDRLVGFLTLLLEGEGGVFWILLWTILVLLLLLKP